MYRMFDEMDGKQARRTGNSSPLGLLFDHGCDAFSMGFQSMVIAKCLQAGDNMWCLLAIMMSCASFHFCTLEEYYTGGLYLGPFNGVTDGSVGVILMFLIMGLAGNEFWVTEIFGEAMRLVDILILFLILG